MASASVYGDDPDLNDAVILGVDGGGTRTRCVCMRLIPVSGNEHEVLGEAIHGASNQNSEGVDSARKTLESVLMAALVDAKKDKSAVKAVFLGVSGLDLPDDLESTRDWLSGLFPGDVKLYVQNDALPALASAETGKLEGCVLIAGTGTICYGFTGNGNEFRAAGYGHLLGDCGSGIWISAQALNAVLRAHDGRGPVTMLSQTILKDLQLKSPPDLISWAYKDSSWSHIAKLAPLVFSCAISGDSAAQNILNHAVMELASTVKAVVQKLSLCGEDGLKEFPVVLVGGVFTPNSAWDIGPKLVDCVKKTYPGAFQVRPKISPQVGACILARKNYFQGN